ncbi:hypothetical protein LPJ63_000696 [Coemansia sp. RSA 2711]|nr:hypothetical protein LPJ63_000696 [Coemansia sp. RSA 2711]
MWEYPGPLRPEYTQSKQQAEATESKTDTLRALINELEDLKRSVGGADGGSVDPAQEIAAEDEASVHQQTLRLAYAATQDAARDDVGDGERAQLAGFFSVLAAGAGCGKVDEKLAHTAAETARHLRRFAARDGAKAPQLAGIEEASYADIAGIVDRMLGGQSSSGSTQAAARDAQAVRVPKIAAMTVNPGTASAEDSEFSVQVVVPPGGLSFIASAEIVNGSDGEEAADGVSMPEPAHGGTEAAAAGGGFAQPVRALTQPVAAGEGGAEVSMPVPVDHAATAPAGHAPSGFDAAQGGWAAATSAGAASLAASGAYGMLPMPYPPHMGMQCAYLPPPMYSMPGMGVGPALNATASARGSPAGEAGLAGEMWAGRGGDKPEATQPPAPMVPDLYQQQAMLAGGYMYPHVDASNLSTAATGGSENNGSENSDAASNGGSLYLAEGAARGAEYGQAPQYMWPQEPKHAPPAYGYQQGHQGHQGQAGYRRRGSGSGAQAGQRDRRGHHGSYHHRQRSRRG